MRTETSRCFLLLIDGLRPDVAEARLAAGDLPHLADMLAEGGHTRAITVFPSTTSVAYLPFLTGCTPGRCNVPSIRWLDRRAYSGRWWREREAVRSYCGYQASQLDADIAPDVRTVFELVPESIGIFTPVAKGLTPARDPSRRERQFWGALAHYVLWHQPSDDAVARHLLRAADGPARFVFAQFPAVDGYTHQTHAGSGVRAARPAQGGRRGGAPPGPAAGARGARALAPAGRERSRRTRPSTPISISPTGSAPRECPPSPIRCCGSAIRGRR